MIELYYWPTPNGHKITIFLEEANLPYRLQLIDIGKGDQLKPDFLKIAPNNKIPAIVDTQPQGQVSPISIFESGAILLYLADKIQRFISPSLPGRAETLQWLFWQVANLGPMLGQNHHFTHYANVKIPYAIERYVKETSRLYAVLNKHLNDRQYIADEYSIADMACYPWIVLHERQLQDLEDFPNLKRWFTSIQERPAVKRAYEIREKLDIGPTMTQEAKSVLFGQDSNIVKK